MGYYYIKGAKKEFFEGETLLDIAQREQKNYKNDILLFREDIRLRELFSKARDGMHIEAVTAEDSEGMDCYMRSALFLLMKTIYDVAGEENIERVRVLYRMETDIFVEITGSVTPDESFSEKLDKRMREYADKNIPVKKRVMPTEDAIVLFEGYKMYDKKNLLEYKTDSNVNIYSIGGFDDYYFGALAPSTGYIKYFEISPYEGGILLRLPSKEDPQKIKEFKASPKVFSAIRGASSDFKKMKVETVADLNNAIVKGRLNRIIVAQETLMERRIAEIADKIASKPECRFVLIAGPSSSGKTTFSRRLSSQLTALGLDPHPISLDDYFLNYADIPLDENGEPDRENINAVDLALFEEDMRKLLDGKRIQVPHYNFKTGKREYNGRFIQLNEGDILVIEGIHGLNERLSAGLPDKNKFKIYICPLVQLNIDERNPVTTTDGRLIRRIVRDARNRGTDAETTINWWPSVRKGEEKNIFPYQESADVIFNSATVYELAALKVWAEPLLHGVSKTSPEYSEARRLLRFFCCFLPIDNDSIPSTSLVREFIGGSCFEGS